MFDNDPAKALTHLQRAAAIVPGTSLIDTGVAITDIECGQRADAVALFRKMESQADTKGYTRYSLALVSVYLGDRDRLFHWLEQSVELHEQQALNMRIDPSLAEYQRDPRMVNLARRVGLLPVG